VHPDQLMAAFAADGAFIWAAGADALLEPTAAQN
jgi:hypothetical protein